MNINNTRTRELVDNKIRVAQAEGEIRRACEAAEAFMAVYGKVGEGAAAEEQSSAARGDLSEGMWLTRAMVERGEWIRQTQAKKLVGDSKYHKAAKVGLIVARSALDPCKGARVCKWVLRSSLKGLIRPTAEDAEAGEWLLGEEACAYLGVNLSTLKRWARAGAVVWRYAFSAESKRTRVYFAKSSLEGNKGRRWQRKGGKR